MALTSRLVFETIRIGLSRIPPPKTYLLEIYDKFSPAPSAGIEPTLRTPQARGLSVSLRGRTWDFIIRLLRYARNDF